MRLLLQISDWPVPDSWPLASAGLPCILVVGSFGSDASERASLILNERTAESLTECSRSLDRTASNLRRMRKRCFFRGAKKKVCVILFAIKKGVGESRQERSQNSPEFAIEKYRLSAIRYERYDFLLQNALPHSIFLRHSAGFRKF